MTEEEKEKRKTECKKMRPKIVKMHPGTSRMALNYLSSGNGTIPYEVITRFDLLDIEP